MNHRQKKIFIYSVAAIFVAWTIGSLSNWVFISSLLSPVFLGGALVYSNSAYLKCRLSYCLSVTIIALLILTNTDSAFLLGIYFYQKAYAFLFFACSLAMLILLLKKTQRQIHLGIVQVVSIICLSGIYTFAVYKSPAFEHGGAFHFSEIQLVIFLLFVVLQVLISSKEGFKTENDHSLDVLRPKNLMSVTTPGGVWKFIKFAAIAIVGCFLIYFSIVIFLVWGWGGFEDPVSEMADNFEEHKEEFYSVKQYVKLIDPMHKANSIEFTMHPDHGVFVIEVNENNVSGDYEDLNSWQPSDYLTNYTPWTKETITVLKEKLDRISCRAIKIDEQFSIKHAAFNKGGGYWYKLHSYPLEIAQKNLYSDTCNYIIYKDEVIFEYEQISKFDDLCFPR